MPQEQEHIGNLAQYLSDKITGIYYGDVEHKYQRLLKF